MKFIAEYISTLADAGMHGADIAKKLGVSNSMVSSYKAGSFNPSITVAKKVYLDEGIIFHPFSEESLKHEIKKDRNENTK